MFRNENVEMKVVFGIILFNNFIVVFCFFIFWFISLEVLYKWKNVLMWEYIYDIFLFSGGVFCVIKIRGRE